MTGRRYSVVLWNWSSSWISSLVITSYFGCSTWRDMLQQRLASLNVSYVLICVRSAYSTCDPLVGSSRVTRIAWLTPDEDCSLMTRLTSRLLYFCPRL